MYRQSLDAFKLPALVTTVVDSRPHRSMSSLCVSLQSLKALWLTQPLTDTACLTTALRHRCVLEIKERALPHDHPELAAAVLALADLLAELSK